MTDLGVELTQVSRADVYQDGELAAHLTRIEAGVEFGYTADWVANARRPIATTLPVTARPVLAVGGAVPAYFAGLLPEGRRLSALRRSVKTSGDDELTLLLAVGSDPVGDVQVVPEGAVPTRAQSRLTVASFEEVRFTELLAEHDITVDRVGIPGVQDKASLAMINVPVGLAGRRYILKLNPPEYRNLVQNEAFFLARAAGSRVAAASGRLVSDHDGIAGLVVTRFDRILDGDRCAPWPWRTGARPLASIRRRRSA